jgi:predicted HD phosphohydrolase
MASREKVEADRVGKLALLEAENARLRWVAAQLAADMGELRAARGEPSRDGAVDPAHRLLAAAVPKA